MQNVCFTVGGATNLGSVSQPYSGTYTPNQPFNNLVGCDPNGVWTLEIEAPTGITIGSGIFSGWSITFDDPPIHAPVTASWSPTTGLSNPNSINTQACPTANTNYVLTVSNGTPGCSTHQETVPITIGPCNGCTPPSVSVSPLAACDLSTLNLANAINPSSAPAILSYHSNLADAQNDANPVSTSVSTPGSYWVRAEDPADPTCYGVHEIIVTQGSIGLQVVNSTSPDCNQTNGSITVSASGGDGSYQYRINGGTYSTSPTFNNLASGNYSIEVIDGSGVCSNTIAVNLTSTSGPTITSLTSTNVTCFGSNDGTVTIVATGTGTLTYVLTDGVGFILNNTTGSFTNVPPGNYTVGVTDPSNCTFTQLVTITQGNALQLSYTTIDESCQGSCDGEINWQSTGGTAPLVVTLDGITATGGNSSALCPGNYTLVVTDNNGCSATENITISSGSGINVGSIDVVHDGCSDDCTGSITINSSNSLVYTLNGVSNTTGLFANLCGGTYELTTENSAGCSSTTSIIISSDAAPSAFFGFNPNAPTIFDSEVDFNNYSTNASLYYWEISDMTTGYFYSTSEEEFSHLFPSDTAHYNVCLIAYNLSGCSDTMCLEVIVYDDLIIYVPNTFTPDGNEFNQNLKIFANGIDRYNFNFQIFNRWGELIFETNDASTGWDGTYKGEIVQDGTYSWKMQVKQPNNDFRKMVTGYVNVLR
jgi:gliding motility-associated-like protein